MLETGISLVAVNLPSLWLLLNSIAPQSIVRSLRNILSLHSLRRKGSGGTDTRDRYVAKGSPSKSLKSRHLTAAARVSDYRSHDLEAQTSDTAMTEIEEVLERDSLDMGSRISRVQSFGLE